MAVTRAAGTERRGARAGVLVRPHPANSRQWRAFDASSFSQVSLWPPVGSDPNGLEARRTYVDSLWHCAAVVGINTSAQIEAAIVGRPVFTIRDAGFAHAQDGTLHFRHLVEDGGPVQVADTLDAHVRQLGEFLERGHELPVHTRAFVRGFVRPHGLERPAAPIFAATVAGLCALPRLAPEKRSVVGPPVPAARPVEGLPGTPSGRGSAVLGLRPPSVSGGRGLADGSRTRTRSGGWLSLARLGIKRVRRAVWRIWYESSRAVELVLGRVRKPMIRGARYASRVARRVVGKQA